MFLDLMIYAIGNLVVFIKNGPALFKNNYVKTMLGL